MIHALPAFHAGRATLEFWNNSPETVTVSGADALPNGFPNFTSIDFPVMKLEPGKRWTVDVTASLVRLMEALQQSNVQIQILLSLGPNVNSGKDSGRYKVG